MKAADELDRVLKGEDVEASQPVRELAELAALLQGAWQEGPAPDATARVRESALAAFAAAPTMPIAPPVVPARPGRPRKMVARLALVAALVAGLPTAAWGASADALPGELLYPVKRGFEEVRLVLAGDAASEAEVLLGMVDERLGEALFALSRGLDGVVDDALVGYDDALLRFQAAIVQAEAEGLPVEGLLEEAGALATVHQEVFEAPAEPTAVVPAEAPAAPAEPGEKAGGNGKGDGKGGGKGDERRGGGRKHEGNGGNGGGTSTQSSGGGGGTSTGGGGGGGGGLQDGKQEDPPAPSEDEGDGDHDQEGSGSGSGSGEGKGLGHEKAKGKGHEKHHDD